MKKNFVLACVLAVMLSLGICGECWGEDYSETAYEDGNMGFLQDIIKEDECQVGMAFLGYVSDTAKEDEIFQFTRQEEWLRSYPFLQNGTFVDAGGFEVYAIVPGYGCSLSVYSAYPSEEGDYVDDLETQWYKGQTEEVIILRCNMSEICSNVLVLAEKQNLSVKYHPMVSLKDGHLAAEPHCYDFSIYNDDGYNEDGYYNDEYYNDEYYEGNSGEDDILNVETAQQLLASTDEVQYYLGCGMTLWYTGMEEIIDGRSCMVFVLGTEHGDYFTKENYYAVGDDQVYYYDVIDDAWYILGAG